MKEQPKCQELPDSWKLKEARSLFANLMTPYTGKTKSYKTIELNSKCSCRKK